MAFSYMLYDIQLHAVWYLATSSMAFSCMLYDI